MASQLAEINSQAQVAQGADAAIGEALTEETPAQAAPSVAKDAPEPAAEQAAPEMTVTASGETETTA